MEFALSVVALVMAAVPALLFLRNLRIYRASGRNRARRSEISVLIPARNEEKTIGAAVAAVLANDGVSLEVLVWDDGSTDATAIVVQAIAAVDSRVMLLRGEALPAGWCGKQHACAELARRARYSVLCFLDADVRLRQHGLARMLAFLDASAADLASGVPRQETVTLLEKLLIPLIHFVLLGFLPLQRMRRSTHPSYAAGCGQLFITKSESYRTAGGHAAIRTTLHDGVNLPRAFRHAGLKTDLFDATEIATCRMYQTSGDVWRGLKKNATEGLASPPLILPATLILGIGQIIPVALLFGAVGLPRLFAACALLLTYICRIAAMRRFRQPPIGVILHPVAILLLLAIQWQAFLQRIFGATVEWKGRSYGRTAGSQQR